MFEGAAAIAEAERQLLDGSGQVGAIRALNDRLMKAERALITRDENLYQRDEGWYRHVVYAPSYVRGYDAVVFPGVTEASTSKKKQEPCTLGTLLLFLTHAKSPRSFLVKTPIYFQTLALPFIPLPPFQT